MDEACCMCNTSEGRAEVEYLGLEKANNYLCVADRPETCQAARVTEKEGEQSLLFILSQTQWYLDMLPTLMSSNYFQVCGADPLQQPAV